MAGALNYFRGKIFWRSTECICHLISGNLQFTQTEVSQLNVTFVIEDDVLWLQISVDDPVTVEALERQYNFSGIKSCSVFSKLLFLAQMEKEFATVEEINDKIETFWSLKCIVKLDDEGMVNPL